MPRSAETGMYWYSTLGKSTVTGSHIYRMKISTWTGTTSNADRHF